MRSFPWKLFSRVLYICTCGNVEFSFDSRCAVWGIGSVSSEMMCSVSRGGHLGEKSLLELYVALCVMSKRLLDNDSCDDTRLVR